MLHPMRHLLLLFAILAGSSASADPPACTPRSFEASAFTVCPFDAKRKTLRLAWTDARGHALRGFAGLEAQLKPQRVAFAMNAGMFDSAGNPIGLYVENGAVRHPLNNANGAGNFYMKPNGVFSQDADGTLHVETAGDFAARHASPRWATQSGPMLLVKGALHPQIAPDGPSRNIRNGVCVRNARTAIFVISGDTVSFGRLARFFRDVLHCRNALYFDGVVSSLWAPSLNRRDNAAPLGPMVLVTNNGRR